MSERQGHLTQERLRSPRSAAIAGLIFSVLLGAIIIMIQVSFPADPAGKMSLTLTPVRAMVRLGMWTADLT